MIMLRLHIFGKNGTEVRLSPSFGASYQRVRDAVCLTPDDVNLDHLVKVVSGGILQVTVFPSVIDKYLSDLLI